MQLQTPIEESPRRIHSDLLYIFSGRRERKKGEKRKLVRSERERSEREKREGES